MINLNLREVLKQTSHLSARKNGSHVDLSYNLEAEIEVICIPEFDQFPFNRHTCHVNVSHKCKINPTLFQGDQLDKNRGPIDLCCQQDVDADEATRDDPLWLRPHRQLSHWKRVSWTPIAQLWWILFCWRKPDRMWSFSQCDFSHGVSNPSDIYSVVGLELNFHMKWTRWLFFRWHILTFHRYIFLYYIPTGLIVVTSWIFFLLPSTSYPARFSTRFNKRSLEIFWQDGTSGHRLSASHQHLLWGCQRHSEHQWRA